MFMLQPAYHIEADHIEAENFSVCRLVMLIDDQSMSYVILNTETKQPICIKYFHFAGINKKEQIETIREIMQVDEPLSKEMGESFLVYGFPDSVLVPDTYFNESLGHDFMNLMQGNLEKGLVLTEKVPWWDIHNVYKIPFDIQKLFRDKFDSTKQLHHYSLLLKSHKKFNATPSPENIYIIFCQEKMIVSVYKKNQVQLMQCFEFADKMDIVYHLLNCCHTLELNREQVGLQVSGFIEEQSEIYKEVAKYFPDISFEKAGEDILPTEKLEKYPLHYFSALLKLAVCV
jgi:hypothetical protein